MQPFDFKDCALIAMATGHKALSLRELRDGLAVVPPGSIYHHFWGGLMLPRLEVREYNNDFAAWARRGLRDSPLAERLAILDPSSFQNLEELRQEVIELVEQRLDESDILHWIPATTQFEFVSSQIVVFDTRKRAEAPEALAEMLPHVSTGTVFYHFVDGRRRSESGLDDFRSWLKALAEDYSVLEERLAEIDPYFQSLVETRERLAEVFADSLAKVKVRA